MEQRSARSALQRGIFDLAVAVGGRRFDARQRRTARGAARSTGLAGAQARWLPRRVLAAFGGRLRIALSGGAPIGDQVIRLFLALGLDILQGYGMTETSPVVAVNTPGGQ